MPAGGGLPLHDPLHPEVRTLRERLEEEHMALLARYGRGGTGRGTAQPARLLARRPAPGTAQACTCLVRRGTAPTAPPLWIGPDLPFLLAGRERDKMALEERIARLARCILQGAAAATQMERRLRAPAGEQAAAAGLLANDRRGGRAAADGPGAPLAAAPPPPLADVAATVGGVRSAGALFPGQQLEQASTARWAAWVDCDGGPLPGVEPLGQMSEGVKGGSGMRGLLCGRRGHICTGLGLPSWGEARS